VSGRRAARKPPGPELLGRRGHTGGANCAESTPRAVEDRWPGWSLPEILGRWPGSGRTSTGWPEGPTQPVSSAGVEEIVSARPSTNLPPPGGLKRPARGPPLKPVPHYLAGHQCFCPEVVKKTTIGKPCLQPLAVEAPQKRPCTSSVRSRSWEMPLSARSKSRRGFPIFVGANPEGCFLCAWFGKIPPAGEGRGEPAAGEIPGRPRNCGGNLRRNRGRDDRARQPLVGRFWSWSRGNVETTSVGIRGLVVEKLVGEELDGRRKCGRPRGNSMVPARPSGNEFFRHTRAGAPAVSTRAARGAGWFLPCPFPAPAPKSAVGHLFAAKRTAGTARSPKSSAARRAFAWKANRATGGRCPCACRKLPWLRPSRDWAGRVGKFNLPYNALFWFHRFRPWPRKSRMNEKNTVRSRLA